MGRKSTRGVYRERRNYSGLLAELQGQNSGFPSDEKGRTLEAEMPQISSFRQRIMSDERVRYLYGKGGNVLHDKTCSETRKISDQDLFSSERYLNHLRPCPLCQTKAYLRLGARDFSRFADYEAIFEQMQISPQLQRRMYVHEGMRTEYLGPGRIKLWGSEDTWILESLSGTGSLRLLHNNYRALEDGTRQFTPGYHEQMICASAKYAVSVIAKYTYAKHKAAMEQRQATSAAVDTPAAPRPLSLWEHFKQWLKKICHAWRM